MVTKRSKVEFTDFSRVRFIRRLTLVSMGLLFSRGGEIVRDASEIKEIRNFSAGKSVTRLTEHLKISATKKSPR